MLVKLQDWVGLIFIAATGVLSLVSILGVWQIFSDETLIKSFETFGILAFACVVILAVGAFIEARSNQGSEVVVAPTPLFKTIRKGAIFLLIGAAGVLSLVGVLAIWEVVVGDELLTKSIVSLGIAAFSTFVIVVTCFEREHSLARKNGGSSHPILWAVVIVFISLSALGALGQIVGSYIGR